MSFNNIRGLGFSPLHRMTARGALLRRAGIAQEFNQPSGWLFGEKPLKPGQKRKWESWEFPFYFLYWGGMGVFALAYHYKPDTKIQTWALIEAKKRLKERGENFDYPHTPIKW
ncbi:hypothetical protein IWQ60_005372 [Tieghemiomyces parasiticus]|uniref:NADH dehydrogenase [ubiquinone] 1 beta subcomplex subunit 11, mitochondrial n=1 Tax=Tieghemiomyces parasiticus TaxID=78921 RepID=A0A9W8AE68_9FUNG|nr:hypothetical protein IWQ60_006718 [Tieghemiomyces parasiticus]KAJ1924202.1 hypothetical protein IWQ60_005372 [Tieghemiomyces parasiticus]